MIFTNDERHERAKNFRDMVSAREYGIPGKVGSFVDIDDLLSELLDRRVYDSEVAIDACEALGIADLIDRPVYRPVIPNAMEGYVFCPQCGAPIGEYGVPNYCHSCGAAIRNGH